MQYVTVPNRMIQPLKALGFEPLNHKGVVLDMAHEIPPDKGLHHGLKNRKVIAWPLLSKGEKVTMLRVEEGFAASITHNDYAAKRIYTAQLDVPFLNGVEGEPWVGIRLITTLVTTDDTGRQVVCSEERWLDAHGPQFRHTTRFMHECGLRSGFSHTEPTFRHMAAAAFHAALIDGGWPGMDDWDLFTVAGDL